MPTAYPIQKTSVQTALQRVGALLLSSTVAMGLVYATTSHSLAQGAVEPVNFVSGSTTQPFDGSVLSFTPPSKSPEMDLVKAPAEMEQQAQGSDSGSETAPTEDMPSALTNPVLENVPTTLDKSQMGESTDADQPASLVPPKDDTKPLEKASDESGDHKSTEVQQGPKLRQRFSVLFTEQRPFLLYAQDASITYLMPNALVEHPWISHMLRSILEARALKHWQRLRAETAKDKSSTPEASGERPIVAISGRVEDRLSSERFSSLYLKEITVEGTEKKPEAILSFNFDHSLQKPFVLRDLFQSKSDDALQATVDLIAAYISADVVRQKSIRLGTPISKDQDSWLKDLKPDLHMLQTFTLVPSRLSGKIAGLSFHFNPGILGAGADGAYEVYVPASIFAASLTKRFAGMFEGEAMLVSRHNASSFSTASVNLDGLRAGAELGGTMQIEGEVPGNWCDGFHLTLVDNTSGQIVTEALVELLPKQPSYGLAGNMMRFRAELPVTGSGDQSARLVFEPYGVKIADGRAVLREKSACDPSSALILPDPSRDSVAISVTY